MSQINLESLSEQWKKTEEKIRDAFYDENVFPAIKKLVVPREQANYPQPYTNLILPVGFSPEPLILSILILRPDKVYLLYTQDSAKYLDRIVSESGLKISQIDKDEILETNVPAIYQKVKAIYERWGKPSRIAVDISGGKKSMVGGCALAGSLIGADLFYVDSKFISALRKPEPGSEKLVILANPYDVFGDLKLERARELYAQLDYIGAQRILDELQHQTSSPELYDSRVLLCESYAAWDDWKIDSSLDKMRQAISRIERYAHANPATPLNDRLVRLKPQLSVLENLDQALQLFNQEDKEGDKVMEMLATPDLYLAMMATLYNGATRQEAKRKLDVAALLWYRLIELIGQQRLSFHGIKTSQPDYSNLPSDLLDKYKSVYSTLFKGTKVDHLPNPISLLSGYILLSALKDQLVEDLKLTELRGKVDARDQGIFAHGFKPLTEGEYNKFKDMAVRVVGAFRKIDGNDQSCWNDCQFIETL